MKKLNLSIAILLVTLLLLSLLEGSGLGAQNIAITDDDSYNADSSAMLDIKSSTKGFLLPRMTVAERNSIVSPANGLFIYCTECNELQYYNGTNWVSVTSSNSIPATIANSATSIDCNDFSANWNVAVGATSYFLDVATDASFTAFVAGYNNLNVGNVISYNVTGLAESTLYYYRVRTIFGSCQSSSSNIQAVTTITIPTAPTTTVATGITNTSFIANWTATLSTNEYFIDVATDINFTSIVTGYNNLNVGNVTTRNISGLVCFTNYYYRVRASNYCGTSVNSNSTLTTTGNGEIWYRDFDNDMWGDDFVTVIACTQPAGYVNIGMDCDDTRPDANLGMPEICWDGIDNNCFDGIDEYCE